MHQMLKWVPAGVFVIAVLCAPAASGQALTSAGDPSADAFGGVVVLEDANAPAAPAEPAEPSQPKSPSSASTPTSSTSKYTPLPSGPARPVHPAWTEAVERFTRAVESGDADGVAATVAGGAAVTPFRGGRNVPAPRLVEQVAGQVLLGFHAYHHPPVALAADVAADVAAAPIVPEDQKRHFFPLDDMDVARSNDIAAHWVNQVLSPERHQAVGVIVWWDVVTAKPAFMLIKGEPIGAKQYDIVQVVFGNPLARDEE
jgi:hypothetical protein